MIGLSHISCCRVDCQSWASEQRLLLHVTRLTGHVETHIQFDFQHRGTATWCWGWQCVGESEAGIGWGKCSSKRIGWGVRDSKVMPAQSSTHCTSVAWLHMVAVTPVYAVNTCKEKSESKDITVQTVTTLMSSWSWCNFTLSDYLHFITVD